MNGFNGFQCDFDAGFRHSFGQILSGYSINYSKLSHKRCELGMGHTAKVLHTLSGRRALRHCPLTSLKTRCPCSVLDELPEGMDKCSPRDSRRFILDVIQTLNSAVHRCEFHKLYIIANQPQQILQNSRRSAHATGQFAVTQTKTKLMYCFVLFFF